MALKTPGAPTGNLSTGSAIAQRPRELNRRDFESQGSSEALTLCSALPSADMASLSERETSKKLFPLRWEFFELESWDWNSS